MRCVIFDLDGTLADTSGDLLASANHCFERMGREVRLDRQKDAWIALRGGRMMLRKGLEREDAADEALIDEWYPELIRAYAENIDADTQLYPGAVEAVEALRSDGYAVGICTNKPEDLAEELLRRLGVRDLFASMIGADTLPVKKPNPDHYWAAVDQAGGTRARSLLVGDSDTDRNTALAAGVPCVLVTFPPGAQDVVALAPEAVIDHFDELPAAVAKMIG